MEKALSKQEKADYPGHTRETSFYTATVKAGGPAIRTALIAGAGVALAAWLHHSSIKKQVERWK